MSRWDDEFRNHPFQSYWQALKSEVPKLTVDDMTIATNTQEVARLRKVIAYLDTVIEAVDPELVPPSTWSNFVGQAEGCLQQVRAYISNRDIGHINNANANADNLLSYVKPYMVAPSDVAKAENSALLAYQQQVESHLKAVSVMAANIGDASRAELDSLKQSAQFARDKADEIRALRVVLLEGTGEQPSAAAEIELLRSRAQAAESEIQSFQRRLFVESDQPSIKSAVDQVVNAINRDVETIQKTLLLTQGKVNELDVFYTKIFGEPDATGSPISGLKLELDQRTKQLALFESTQLEKYNAMYTRIETLLPGATSAGLATAYRALTRSFSEKIKMNTRFFYAAVLAIPIIAILFSVQSFAIWPLAVSFTPIKSYDELLRISLAKIPFVAPLVWLAIFASMRRSQYERLQQEYAHKEALAKSYESYKRQLDALQVPDVDSLKKELIAKAIEAVAFNASTTLNGNHREALPAEALFDFIRDEKNVGVIERLKGLVSSEKK
ncbi:hypothetical protein [Duganella hordei]|uniref:hypothetical protein n=1 Tax=Duganella hordei TaxID=2865934 RepID=UPI0030EAB9FF